MTHSPREVDAAFRYCERIARDHYENFPVGSLLLSKKRRKHLYSIYAFSRAADDFADEIEYQDDRAERLSDWRERLRRCARGEADHPVFIALGRTIETCGVQVELLDDLLKAFEQDTRVRRYRTFEDLLGYCRNSANPVGRLVLTVFGYREESLYRLSDSICTALQLANFWQDVRIDLTKDRIYLPAVDMDRFSYSEADLRAGRVNPAFRRLMKFQVDRTLDMFREGGSLPGQVRGRLGLELRCVWMGGTRILRRIQSVDYDVFHRRPRLSWRDKGAILLGGLWWRQPGREES